MKPVIGISANYWDNDMIGVQARIGTHGQDWNLLACDYARAIEDAGGIPIVMPIVRDPYVFNDIIGRLDGFLLTGGQDIDPNLYGENPAFPLGRIDPVRDLQEIKLIQNIFSGTRMPILGICRGIQIMNVAFGGSLYQDINSQKRDSFTHSLGQFPKNYGTHSVKLSKGARLKSIYGVDNIMVNSFHHEAVKDAATSFRVSGIAEDGVIEAIEYEGDRFIVGVQWHPEMMYETCREQAAIFASFIEECMK